MPQHYDATIGYVVMSDEERAVRMEALKRNLNTELRLQFQQEVGYPVPTIHQAEILSIETALMACVDARMRHFLAGVRTLVTARFDIDVRVRDWAFDVATTAMNRIFDGAPENKTRGHHATLEISRENGERSAFLAAIYASTVLGKKENWGTEQDFYLAEYVFAVFEPRLC